MARAPPLLINVDSDCAVDVTLIYITGCQGQLRDIEVDRDQQMQRMATAVALDDIETLAATGGLDTNGLSSSAAALAPMVRSPVAYPYTCLIYRWWCGGDW